MHDQIVFYTFIALIIFFIAVEIYRARHYIKGEVVHIYPSLLGIENSISGQMKVRLRDGSEVEAEAFKCTLCLGDFSIGDEVYLTYAKEKYQINLPFRLKRKTNGCKKH
jgi:hypothetical protein